MEGDGGAVGTVVRTPGERARGTWGSQLSRRAAHLLARGLTRLTVRGLDNLPANGVLLAANHASLLDGPLVFGALPRPGTFFVKAEMFTGIPGWFLPRIGQIPVRRGVPERAPLTTALATLAEGGIVGIFPEGTRGGGGDVGEVRHGVAYLALRSGCPVVPVACVGTDRVLPRGRIVPRPRRPVTVAFGRAARVAEPGTPPTRQNVTAVADRVQRLLAEHVRATTGQPLPPAASPAHPAAMSPERIGPREPAATRDSAATREAGVMRESAGTWRPAGKQESVMPNVAPESGAAADPGGSDR